MNQSWVAAIGQDLRFALSRARTRPWRLLILTGIIGLAIGITTATFTLIDSLFIRPVPFMASHELGLVRMRSEHGGPLWVPMSVVDAWTRLGAFKQVEAVTTAAATVGVGDAMVSRRAARLTPGVFELLGGVRPHRGRLFVTNESAGDDNVALISEDLWRSVYQSDHNLVGQTITIDAQPVTVLGILPSGFHFPEWNTVIWRPATIGTGAPGRADERYLAYVRFDARVPKADALRLATMAASDVESRFARQWAAAEPLAQLALDQDYKRAVPLFVGSALLLFLVLCANACSLFLTDLMGRGREFATRAAIGASRARLIGQTLIEAAIPCTAGTLVGVWLGWVLMYVAREVLPRSVLSHSLNALDIDARSLVATSLAAFIAMLCAGGLPAVIGTRPDKLNPSQSAGRAGTDSKAGVLFRRGLLVGQVAVSCAFLLCAVFLARSFVKLVTQERGLDTSGILVVTVVFPGNLFPSQESRTLEAAEFEANIRTLPGIKASAWSYGVPPAGGVNPSGEWTADFQGAKPVPMGVNQFAIDSNFLGLYGIRLVRGRSFQSSDAVGSALVSERFARALWGSGDPTGQSVKLKQVNYRIVGVVKEMYYPSIDKSLDGPQLYLALPGVTNLAMLSLRCGGSCPPTALVQQHLAKSRATIEGVRALEDAYGAQVVEPRAAATLALAFAATALIAGGTGLFSLLSQTVARRRREFGIRTALGAVPVALRALVWREAITIIVPGLSVGTLIGLLLAHTLTTMLFDVSLADPLSWTAVVAIVAGAVLAATWRPSQVAGRSNPALLLKEE